MTWSFKNLYRFLSLLLLVELCPLEFHPGPHLRSSAWSRRTTRYQAVTLSTHYNLYRQQICAISFLFSASEAEISWALASHGLSSSSWRDCLLSLSITAGLSAWCAEGYNNSRRDCWLSSHTHCYCSDSDCYCSCSGIVIFSMHDNHVSHYSISPTLKFKL